jgi:O-antigen ligase
MKFLDTQSDAPPLICWWLWLGLLSVSPIWSKLAGACWVVGILMAMWIWKTKPVLPDLQEATNRWRTPLLVLTLLPLFMRITPHVFWSDSWSERQYDLRMAASGLAIALVSVRVRLQKHHLQQLVLALSLAGALAALHAFAYRRETTSNPIPWATAIGMMPFLLFSMTALVKQSASSKASTVSGIDAWIQWLAVLGAAAAFVAVWLSGTRSALFSIMLAAACVVWCFIAFFKNRQSTGKSVRVISSFRLALVAALLSAIATVAMFKPDLYTEPVSRIQLAWAEANQYFAANPNATDSAHYSTSVGSRLRLYEQSFKSIIAHPWLGLGKQERLNALAFWMRDATAPDIRMLGHNQNEYLHAAMDQGIFGLAAILLGIMAFGWAAWVLLRQQHPMGFAMTACVLIWLAGGIFNVNTAHNFMSNMFGNLMLASLWFAASTHKQSTVSDLI